MGHFSEMVWTLCRLGLTEGSQELSCLGILPSSFSEGSHLEQWHLSHIGVVRRAREVILERGHQSNPTGQHQVCLPVCTQEIDSRTGNRMSEPKAGPRGQPI